MAEEQSANRQFHSDREKADEPRKMDQDRTD
jgi:hypothetical protein